MTTTQPDESAELRAAAQALVAALDAVDPHVTSLYFLAFNKGIVYRGPTYEVELAALRTALSATPAQQPEANDQGSRSSEGAEGAGRSKAQQEPPISNRKDADATVSAGSPDRLKPEAVMPPLPEPYLTIDMLILEIEGDDPMSDELIAIWEEASNASEAAIHPRIRGFSDWRIRTEAACEVLIKKLPALYVRACMAAKVKP